MTKIYSDKIYLKIFSALGAFAALLAGCEERRPPPLPPAKIAPEAAEAPAPAPPPRSPPSEESYLERIRPPALIDEKEGIALALLVDTSQSMTGEVKDSDGSRKRKIEIAKRAAKRVLGKCREFAEKNPGKSLRIMLYEFSGTSPRLLLDLEPGKADYGKAMEAVEGMTNRPRTPIGEALIAAKRDLDRCGLRKKDIILITDGENTYGPDPGDVAKSIARLTPEGRPGIHFIAFDVEAARFDAVKDAGGSVYQANDAPELDQCLDFLLQEKVLLEKPDPPKR